MSQNTHWYSCSENYTCFVSGTNAPVVKHDSYESAFKEACRLASLSKNQSREIFILKVCTSLKQKIDPPSVPLDITHFIEKNKGE